MWCKIERERYEKEEEERIGSIRIEEEAWKYINRYRKKREKIEEDIDLEEWRQHFKELLGETENRVTLEIEKIREDKGILVGEETAEKEEEKKKEDEEITKGEFVEHLKKLKKGKAPGENETENKA